MYINKYMALLQAQHAQFCLVHDGFQTNLSTPSENSTHEIELTAFYETDEEGKRICRILKGLWHDGDTIKEGSSRGIRWYDYQVEFE